jgi:uncharacterized protein (DUF3084 family)
VYARELEAS